MTRITLLKIWFLQAVYIPKGYFIDIGNCYGFADSGFLGCRISRTSSTVDKSVVDGSYVVEHLHQSRCRWDRVANRKYTAHPAGKKELGLILIVYCYPVSLKGTVFWFETTFLCEIVNFPIDLHRVERAIFAQLPPGSSLEIIASLNKRFAVLSHFSCTKTEWGVPSSLGFPILLQKGFSSPSSGIEWRTASTRASLRSSLGSSTSLRTSQLEVTCCSMPWTRRGRSSFLILSIFNFWADFRQ